MKKKYISPISFDPDLIEHSIELTIEGEPVGKGRPRVTTRGKFAHAYTPKKTKNYEQHVQNTYKNKYNFSHMLHGPLVSEILAFFPIPKAASKKKKQLMKDNVIPNTHKPDIDNIEKSVLDSLNDLAYDDDSQIISLYGEKRYSDEPRVELKLKEVKLVNIDGLWTRIDN